MFLPLSALPVILILIQSVTNVDLYKSKRVPRKQRREVGTSYGLNHPTLKEIHIPVSVIYDDEEDILVLSKKLNKVKNTTENVQSNPKNLNDNQKTVLKPDTFFSNHPPSVEDFYTIPVAIVTDYDEENIRTRSAKSLISEISEQKNIFSDVNEKNAIKNVNTSESALRPKGQSTNIKSMVPESEIISETTRNNRKRPAQRRRLHGVRKVVVNKNQTADVIKPEKSLEKVDQKEGTLSNHQPIKHKAFSRRIQERDPIVPIVNSENYVYAYNGDYHYRYEGGDGTKAFERGELKSIEGAASGSGVVGGYSYKDKDGNDFSLSYTADENGYRPVGAHLPTPPPIPPAIQRALDLLATKTTPEPVTEKINKFD